MNAIRPLDHECDLPALRRLMRLCHPAWPDRAPSWFQAYPILVAEQADRLVGYTAFAVAPELSRGVVIVHGRDHGVHPEHRGRGLGMALHVERCRIGREEGAADFLGVTWEGNDPMEAIFRRCGYECFGDLPAHFPDGAAGRIWIGKA